MSGETGKKKRRAKHREAGQVIEVIKGERSAADRALHEIDFKRVNALIQEFEHRSAASILGYIFFGRLSQSEISRLRGLIHEIERLLQGGGGRPEGLWNSVFERVSGTMAIMREQGICKSLKEKNWEAGIRIQPQKGSH
jgi:hypothetical protein